MDHRWIIDKNVSSENLLSQFATVLKDESAGIDYSSVRDKLTSSYKGRASANPDGHNITFGVRTLQLCYYMFGYTYRPGGNKQKFFMPTPATINILNTNDDREKARNMLVNFYSLQYPHPFNRTPECFQLFVGRLITALLLDSEIDRKLYIDEIIWFLPFIEKVTSPIYKDLVKSIIEYRSLSYEAKLDLFKSVPNYEAIFSNVVHEVNYYLLRILEGFHVINIIGDRNHNDGKLFRFKHGDGDGITIRRSSHAPIYETYRNDAYKSRASYSGYICLSKDVEDAAQQLIEKFSVFDTPTKESDDEVQTRSVWLVNLYESNQISYLNCIDAPVDRSPKMADTVQKMIHTSKYGTRDGKEFESALQPFMHLFRETLDVKILSGSGNTDLECVMEDNGGPDYKVNIEAKTRKNSLEAVLSNRITEHLKKTGAQFCLIVAPRFAQGVNRDIKGYSIAAVRSEILGSYCYRECQNSEDGYADFTKIKEIAQKCGGRDITEDIYNYTLERYGIAAVELS